jgi:hypothetical protein
LAQQDSSNLSLSELKLTAQLLTELQYRRDQEDIFNQKEKLYSGIIQNFQSNEKLYDSKIENLELMIEEVKPGWYDHFWVGATVAGIVVSSIYFLAR